MLNKGKYILNSLLKKKHLKTFNLIYFRFEQDQPANPIEWSSFHRDRRLGGQHRRIEIRTNPISGIFQNFRGNPSFNPLSNRFCLFRRKFELFCSFVNFVCCFCRSLDNSSRQCYFADHFVLVVNSCFVIK